MRKSVLKRTISIVLAFVMLMSIFVVVPMQAGATDRKKIQNLSWTLSTNKVYFNDGKNPTWTYMIKDGNYILADGKDYTISYSRKSVGHCVATFKGKGYYQGSRCVDFVILPRPLKLCSVTLPATSSKFTAALQFPKPVVKCGKTVLKEYVDYTVSNSDNKWPGTGKVIVKGIGNYSGTVTKTYTIYLQKPGSMTFKKINENKIKLSWGSSSYCTGYVVQRYTGKGWTAVTTTTSTSCYAPYGPQYRVRAYVTIPYSGVTKHSDWATYKYFR